MQKYCKQIRLAKVQRNNQVIVTVSNSVEDPDPGGSGFKLPGWIWIRIRNPDPGSENEL